ncbi:MAG: VCBS repeat-containing protein, partial [Planctomycetes bacterium]|nr:VCBS repeat-containing protein [Planctomycetota bacterium]
SPGIYASPPLTLGGPGTTDGPSSLVAADLNGDGDLDLASANGYSGLTVFFQESPGVFVASPPILGVDPISLAAADLDGDGDFDLASANNFSLTVFFQDSPGVFGSPPLTLGGFPTTDGPISLAAADFDGDCDLDLASANASGSNLTVFFQESPGVFTTSPLTLGGFGVTNRPTSIAAGDLDGDGDFDLASVNLFGGALTVFLQDSPGFFASSSLILGGPTTTDRPTSLAPADFDGDGDLDLASANAGGPNLTVFFQESPRAFATSPLILGGSGTTDSPTSLAAADLDGNGHLDLASANGGGSNLTVFFQESPRIYASPPLILGGPGTTDGPSSLVAADLNGDGQLDLASANGGGSNLTV